LLAKKTGNPILPFHDYCGEILEAKKSWDQSQVPKPFCRARVDIAAPIYVPADADEDVLNSRRERVTASS